MMIPVYIGIMMMANFAKIFRFFYSVFLSYSSPAVYMFISSSPELFTLKVLDPVRNDDMNNANPRK